MAQSVKIHDLRYQSGQQKKKKRRAPHRQQIPTWLKRGVVPHGAHGSVREQTGPIAFAFRHRLLLHSVVQVLGVGGRPRQTRGLETGGAALAASAD